MELRKFIDQMGREVSIPFPPEKIISLVPSQTELLIDLGLAHKVVGITKFCIHPYKKFKSTVKIGGTKDFHFDVIDRLNPDLIIGNKEENYQKGIAKLSEKYPVWMSDISTLPEALEMIEKVGEITGTGEESVRLKMKINESFQMLDLPNKGTVAYLIWQKPYMIAGTDTFISEMLKTAGFKNAFEDLPRYPVITIELLKERNPDFIFLSSEPYPFKDHHLEEFQSFCSGSKACLVDGEMFSWYGSRLLKSAEYFRELDRQIAAASKLSDG